jgi:hypothetical protein
MRCDSTPVAADGDRAVAEHQREVELPAPLDLRVDAAHELLARELVRVDAVVGASVAHDPAHGRPR